MSFPPTVRTNDYYRAAQPALVAAEEHALSKLFSGRSRGPADAFTIEMAPYLADPFRGTVERRVLAKGETALGLEVGAARRALRLAKMGAADVDLILVSSFLPDRPGVGNAVFLARELGTKRPAWNLETACASGVAGYTLACSLVQAGQFDSVLVVASCTYSRFADDADTLSWFLGDGAAAFVVGDAPPGEGLLGSFSLATTETCDTFYFAERQERDNPELVMRCAPGTGRIIHETAEPHLVTCCTEAAARAGLKLSDVDFFVCNTPSAWFAAFVARALEIDPAKTISTYPRYANIGSALVLANLAEAASEGKIRKGDVVMLYSFGGVSSASAAVIRWGEVAVEPSSGESG